MANVLDFWELVKVAGGEESDTLTTVLDSIVKSDRSTIENYFSNVVDQTAFNTDDWKRLRKFFVVIYAAHRAISTQSSKLSDPSNLSNDELDELFRSFGYTESAILRDYDNNPLNSKIALFLTLVDLYKIKGTPRSMLEVLQFYGITQLDIFEFWLQKETENSLIFKGESIVGTSLNPSDINLSYDLLTGGDPHWILTEQQILELDRINDINLPSKSPYFAVAPIVEFGAETPMFIRVVHDQYEEYKNTGTIPEQDAQVTILGEVVSFLELYLACVYGFQQLYDVGYKGDRYLCYDGDSTSSIQIVQEYETIVAPPITRSNKPIKLSAYYDQFARETPRHFLQNKNDAETILKQINPTFIDKLNALSDSDEDILQSLLRDLGVWVRNNIGFGFIDAGYLTFGLQGLFEDLEGVINFFKPYRARLILLEKILFDSRLMNSIRMDDRVVEEPMQMDLYDFLTGDSKPCCDQLPIDATEDICFQVGETLAACTRVYADTTASINTGLWQKDTAYKKGESVIFGGDGQHDYICTQNHVATLSTKPTSGANWTQFWTISSQLQCVDTTGNTFYNRDTYDCGSYHDIGAITDIAHGTHHDETPASAFPSDVHYTIGQDMHDRLRCYHCTDSTGCVDAGCSDCNDDSYCKYLGYDCMRSPIDTDGYVYSDVIADSTTGIVAAEIRPGVYTTDFDDCYDPYNITDSTGCQAYDSTAFTYYQTGGFADFDTGGMFDCTHGFDMVQITIQERPDALPYLLQETGDKLLQENGDGLLLEEGNV